MIYIENESTDPFFNHALEEYILLNYSEEVFILWRNRPSILIGRNQNTLSEIHLDFVLEQGIDVVRRLSGGGTVFCDLGNINFTFIMNKNKDRDGFEKFAAPVIEALRSLGVPAEFSGRNDITVMGKKISGNAQYHAKTKLLHHGTLLYLGDLSSLKGALNVKPLKYVDKGIKSVGSRVTNIADHMKEPMDVLSFKNYLKAYIMRYHGIKSSYELTEQDIMAIKQIMTQRFMSYEWNYGESPKYTFNTTKKYPCGCVEYHLEVSSGIIKEAAIFGDFFGELPIEELTSTLIGLRHEQQGLMEGLKNVTIQNYITGLSLEDFVLGLIDSE